ncbi:putative bifunctional diguanylate cyclase/phosphodiesterase [Sphingomonas solaris]|nr:EAL domain-containing protein [Sphingomonas solaris]
MLRRHFPTQYLIPIVLLLGSSFGCLTALLFHTTIVQDRMERHREVELVTNGFAASAEMVKHDLQDYARWDDAVRHLVHRFDPAWADGNISAYLGVVQAYSHVLVLDEHGRAIYDFSGGRHRPAGFDPAALLGPGLAAGAARVRRIGPAGNPVVNGFTRMGDRLYVFSAAAIMPLTDKVTLPPGPVRLLVLADRIDQPYLDALAARNHSPRLSLHEIAPDDGGPDEAARMRLHDAAGTPIGTIRWQATTPGSELRRQMLPGFALVVLIALAAAALILRRARTGMESLRGSKARALHQALHDPLTGLGNRRAVMERLDACETAVALLYMDLDGFKETNDVYGHAAGDALLMEAARRIAAAAGEADLVARSGGDEFAIVLCAPGPAVVERIADAILAAFHAPFAVGGYSVSAGISIGIVMSSGRIVTDELIRRADVAMYAAKANGKDCRLAYHPALDEEYDERRRLENDLRATIAAGGIAVVFQPIVEARAGRVVGVEALARWNHPRHGPVSPELFVRVAERSGLINDLGRSVLVTACREAIGWNVDLAVNLSPAQFWDRMLVERIEAALAETGFPADRLELEITESYLLRRPDAAEEILVRLRALGIRIALDDFGTGFASIGYLQRLSFDRIKIDRSFVTHVVEQARAADMARAIVVLAEALDLPVTAEGIETEGQAAIMRLTGCSRLQGWLFGRPMPPAEMGRWLAQRSLALT